MIILTHNKFQKLVHTFEISTQKSTFLFGFTNEIKYLDWFNDIKAIITKETIHSISVTGEKVYHKGDIITQNKLIDVSLFNDGDAPEFQYKTRLTVDPKMNVSFNYFILFYFLLFIMKFISRII